MLFQYNDKLIAVGTVIFIMVRCVFIGFRVADVDEGDLILNYEKTTKLYSFYYNRSLIYFLINLMSSGSKYA